jgi:GxxExxY protein
MNTNEIAIDAREEAITKAILGAAFEVANLLGHGFVEVLYRRALLKELSERGLHALPEVAFPVSYKGELIGNYIADLVVEGSVIVELKAAEALVPAHVSQVLNYLRASGCSVGMLLNFGQERVQYRRILNTR